jgi:predicted AlkP superfamily pyrophosphatase or phosphodiesterase
MRRAASGTWIGLLALLAGACVPRATGPEVERARPRLVLLVAVDQLRYDYLTRFRPGFSGGFAQLLRQGAVFTNAHLAHYPSVTAPGHATMLSGAPPSLSGIVGNDWYDRDLGKNVTSVEDPGVQGLGANAASPHRLLVSTLGDELKAVSPGSKAVGLSLKDRSAILAVGRGADGAFWYDAKSGSFASSTWYFPELPGWVRDWNARGVAKGFAGRSWTGGRLPEAAGPALFQAVYDSPFGNELLADFAEAALAGERLGAREQTDVLSVSFSSNDAVGHHFGPDSAEVEEVTKATDRVLARLFAAVERAVGLDRTLVVLTADHGVAPLPEVLAASRRPGGRLSSQSLVDAAEAALAKAFGAGPWVAGRAGSSLYLDRGLIAERKLDFRYVEEAAARAVEAVPPVHRAFTRSQLLSGDVPPSPWTARLLAGYHPARSGDVEVLLEPYWIRDRTGTTHGSPYSYDTHVPLVFMGRGIRAGSHDAAAALNDLAPTLATLLEVETPSGSTGRVLTEMLAGR